MQPSHEGWDLLLFYFIYGIDSLTVNLVPSGQQVLNKHLLNKSE